MNLFALKIPSPAEFEEAVKARKGRELKKETREARKYLRIYARELRNGYSMSDNRPSRSQEDCRRIIEETMAAAGWQCDWQDDKYTPVVKLIPLAQ